MRGNKKGCMSHGRHGRDPESVARYRKRQSDQYRNDSAYRKRIRDRANSKRYGITVEEYLSRVSLPCEICGQKLERNGRGGGMHIDHDHTTGSLRGTLCHNCNLTLGRMKEDPVRLRAAAAYIEKYASLVATPRGSLVSA